MSHDTRIQLVDWLDSSAESGWRPLGQATAALEEEHGGLVPCRTIGWLLGENDAVVQLASSLGHEHGNETVADTAIIPKAMIVRRIDVPEGR